MNFSKMRFRYGLIGNLVFFGGTAVCFGYLGYLLLISSNAKIDKTSMNEMISKDPRRIIKP